jgi:signal transduction histidine kinase
MKIFRDIFSFVKTYPAILYSFALVLFLPLFLYFSVFYISSKFQKSVDSILQTEALFLTQSLATFSRGFIFEPDILQEKIFQIQKENPKVKQIRILTKENEDFRILASGEKEEVGAILQDPSLILSWSQNQSIATLFSDPDTKERFWKIVTPIGKEKKVGLISLALSLKETDEVILDIVFNAFLLILGGIVVSLILIFQHTSLFGYVQLTQKLQQIDKAKDEFIRMATHELETPIVNIKNYIWEIREQLKEKISKEQKEYLERAETSANNLSLLIEDILAVSRIEQGRVDFTPQWFDPAKEINQIVNEFLPKTKEKNLSLLFEEPKEKVNVYLNLFRFREIISNLLSNAIKYTFEGYVKIGTKVDFNRKKYYIFVKDTGIGISAEAQQKLFQKFFREKKRETAEIPGTGLGLWISKEVARKMGGDILVESIEGQGSNFIVYFPLKTK